MGDDRTLPRPLPGPRTIRARVEGGWLVPLVPLDLPDGTEILMRIELPAPAGDRPPIGTGAAILAALRRTPKLQSGDIEALNEAIEAGKLPVRAEGIFDELDRAIEESKHPQR